MKILCQKGSPDGDLHRLGLINIFDALGYQCVLWDADKTPAFDIFDEYQPDIFLGTGEYRRDLEKCLAETKKTRVVLQNAIPPAADTFTFKSTQPVDNMRCDIAYVGPFTREASKFIFPLCNKSHIKVHIFGSTPWPVAQYLGPLPTHLMPSVFASAGMVLNLDGPETPERVYQVVSANGFCASVPLADPTWRECLLKIENPDSLMGPDYTVLLKNAKLRRQKIREARQGMLEAGHTYWHRATSLFLEFKFSKEAIRTMALFDATTKI